MNVAGSFVAVANPADIAQPTVAPLVVNPTMHYIQLMETREPFHPGLDGQDYYDALETHKDIEQAHGGDVPPDRVDSLHKRAMTVAGVAVVLACLALGKLSG